MKLKTIKQLINGRYVNIDLDETYTGKVMNIINTTYIFAYVFYLISILISTTHETPTELVLKQAFVGAIICTMLVMVTCFIGLYFALCETCIGED